MSQLAAGGTGCWVGLPAKGLPGARTRCPQGPPTFPLYSLALYPSTVKNYGHEQDHALRPGSWPSESLPRGLVLGV